MERGDSLNGKIGYEPRRVTSHVSGPKKSEQIMHVLKVPFSPQYPLEKSHLKFPKRCNKPKETE